MDEGQEAARAQAGGPQAAHYQGLIPQAASAPQFRRLYGVKGAAGR
jgi:hypothetical protein